MASAQSIPRSTLLATSQRVIASISFHRQQLLASHGLLHFLLQTGQLLGSLTVATVLAQHSAASSSSSYVDLHSGHLQTVSSIGSLLFFGAVA